MFRRLLSLFRREEVLKLTDSIPSFLSCLSSTEPLSLLCIKWIWIIWKIARNAGATSPEGVDSDSDSGALVFAEMIRFRFGAQEEENEEEEEEGESQDEADVSLFVSSRSLFRKWELYCGKSEEFEENPELSVEEEEKEVLETEREIRSIVGFVSVLLRRPADELDRRWSNFVGFCSELSESEKESLEEISQRITRSWPLPCLESSQSGVIRDDPTRCVRTRSIRGRIQWNESEASGAWETVWTEIRGGTWTVFQGHFEDSRPRKIIQLFACEVELVKRAGVKEAARLRSPSGAFIAEVRTVPPDSHQESDLSLVDWLKAVLDPILDERGNRHDCFAPVRYNTNCVFFVNGKSFYERCADVFEMAEKEIMISAWWIVPQVYLRRGESATFADRLDNILLKRAADGILIYLLLWNHPAFMSRLDCEYVAGYFAERHPNFKVLLHPFSRVDFCHHQKMLVVDQRWGFQGGLDLCYGRYDDERHVLNDECHLHFTWPGKDYWNPSFSNAESIREPDVDYFDRTRFPRMGWHDVSIEVDGLAALDLARNFIERWNNSRTELCSLEMNLVHRLAIEKNIPLLVVNDEAVYSDYDPPWMRYYLEMPERVVEDASISGPLRPVRMGKNLAHVDNMTDRHTSTVQVTRSLCRWSGATRHKVDDSLYQSHLYVIQKAQHYILIIQQYFCTDTCDYGGKFYRWMNTVGSAILDRLRWAIQNERVFRLIIVIPLQADADFRGDHLGRIIMHLNMHGVFGGESSIVKTLQREFPDVDIDEYVACFCYRNWGILGEKLVVDQVYPHTKMMVVDDQYAIVGSANINDRGFCGDRDSEISTTFKDNCQLHSRMNGEEFWAGKCVLQLRLFLFNEMVGFPLEDQRLIDPVCHETYWRILNAARKNAGIYREVFPNSLGDNTPTWDKVRPKEEECVLAEGLSYDDALTKLQEIEGIVHDFPRDFLLHEVWPVGSKFTLFLTKEVFV